MKWKIYLPQRENNMITKRIFIDTETTSEDQKRAGVFQIAGIIEYEKICEQFDFHCNIFDGDLVEDSAFKTNEMSIEKIMKFPDPVSVFQQFIGLLSKHVDRYNKNDKFTAIGYFSEFDAQILRNWFKKNRDDFFGSYFWHPWIDVAQLAAYVYQEDRDIFPNFRLGTIAYAMALVNDKEDKILHNALIDAKITQQMSGD